MKFYLVFAGAVLSLSVGFRAFGQDLDSDLSQFFPAIQRIHQFSRNIPHEKVYLHFDNTSYYQGDNIWFKCYVVSAQNELSLLSKTLYVDLLNPGGEVIDRRILKIENGQCHGDFSLTRYPFYSGFYEVRAYTKYMLNFGEDVIFSRLLPVFDRPQNEGDFEDRRMLAYNMLETSSYPVKREQPERGQTVNLRFFPEGGHLIRGVASRIAFEATDGTGNPIDVTGTVRQWRMENGAWSMRDEAPVTTLHEGKGIFTYKPGDGSRSDIVEVEYEGRTYRFDLPAVLPQGVVMEVDNLSHPDSIGITLRKNADTPSEMLGAVLLSGGKPQKYCFARMEDNELYFSMDKTQLPSGVSQIVLFDRQGEIVCDRLIFVGCTDERLDIRAKTDKMTYRPYESVEMEFTVTDRAMNPVNATFSLSVRDGANEVESHHTILTDLLLMSEIKGYVRNPAWYFADGDGTRRSALDLLLMVQGWRRYSWEQIAGIESLEIKYRPEQGIETHGQILTIPRIGRPAPRPDVDVSLFLVQREDDESVGDAFDVMATDRQGRFSFVADVSGRWNMVLSVSEKGRPRDYGIYLDRHFSPDPVRYRYAELQVNIRPPGNDGLTAGEMPGDRDGDDDAFFLAYQDSIAGLDMDEKTHLLNEVLVTARRTGGQSVFNNRSTSVAYYDFATERNNLYDSNGYTGRNINHVLAGINPDFYIVRMSGSEILYYKHKRPLFIINHKRSADIPPVRATSSVGSSAPINISGDVVGNATLGVVSLANYVNAGASATYQLINPASIKSLYINEEMDVICQYANFWLDRMEVERLYGCVVFIETYDNEADIPVDDGKGVRKTWLEGYSPVREFYSPNYAELPPLSDYRRTLYWNPMVTPDENCRASIQFYNNSNSTTFKIHAEAITPQGTIGMYND